MPRPIPVRWPALGLFVVLLAPGAGAQDATQVAKDAKDKLGDIQKALASGKAPADKDGKQKDVPDAQRLRVDAFEVKGGKLAVAGVFLDDGAKPAEGAAWSPAFAAAKDDLEKIVLAAAKHPEAKVEFEWADLKRVGGVTAQGASTGSDAPHVLIQRAANKDGAAASAPGQPGVSVPAPPSDRLVITGARFGPAGQLVLVGLRDDDADVLKWLAGTGAKALEGSPAVGKAPVSWDGVKAVAWTVSAKGLQKLFATSDEKAYHRLLVVRAYCAAPAAPAEPPVFRVEGFRIGKAALPEPPQGETIELRVRTQVKTVWDKLTAGSAAKEIKIDSVEDLISTLGAIDEPVKALQAVVTANPKLDGVRVDPGLAVGPDGELKLAGIEPGLAAPAKTELEAAVRARFAAFGKSGKDGDAVATKYARLADRPVSAAGMTPLPIGKLAADLRDWASKYRDDIRLRLYFVSDLDAIAQKRNIAPANGGGLVLTYQVAVEDDSRAIDAKFGDLYPKAFPKGLPAPDATGAATGKAKEPLLPGLTAELRRIIAADQKEWYGVLIARGYFDAEGRYTVTGAVDTPAQNAKLDALVKRLAAEAKWKAYFTSETGAELPPQAPALAVVPMAEMIDRVKRVTPAYAAFDGIRISSGNYDEKANLVFEAHAVGTVTPEVVGKLAELLVGDGSPYRLRVIRPEPPAAPRVRIKPLSGPAYPQDQIGHFSVGYGARLLAAGEKAKAKEWLDAGLLHYPNVSAVWFLSAYHNFIEGDTELVARDLQRVIELEGPLVFDGPRQRRTRYEWAKELQGPKRIVLEEFWLARYRDVTDGAPPMTLAKPKKPIVLSGVEK